uniref:Reverse transcriptase domain-containing protein n=1 Tax=Trichogramma kaykai TaxID=54128 RepID=A0ABD2WFD5_9HYME
MRWLIIPVLLWLMIIRLVLQGGKNCSLDNRARYKILRNRFQTSARDAGCRHYRERFRECTDSASKWRMLSQLGFGSRTGKSAELPVGVGELNQHFVGTFQSRAADPEMPVSGVYPDERFYFRHVQLTEVVGAIARTQTEARGTDDMPVSFLREYRRIRKELKIRMREARDVYYSRQLASAGDAASLWSVLRRLGLARPTLPSPLKFFGADELVSHYASVTNSGAPCAREELDEILLAVPVPSIIGFGLSRVEAVDVLGALHESSSRARGRSGDGLSLRYLRDVFTVVAPALAEIFNASIEERTYPDMWKETLIVPLSKKSRPETPADTRPVSNLPHLSRVFDRLIARQLSEYLECHGILSDFQSGFRRGFSTQTALLKICGDIRNGMERGEVTLLMLFDFSKAFDTVSHAVLLRRMCDLRFQPSTIEWFHSYLPGRRQAVLCTDGSTSRWEPSATGVPQGSSTGPILSLYTLTHCSRPSATVGTVT